ncbi:MAG: T9SS type A sorting domain-containing protein [Chlorobi bacterium]|nr:T9SS type A sorting domain-containing protein [Chlorobiota bacterium]
MKQLSTILFLLLMFSVNYKIYAQQKGTVTDYDGNVYQTVVIGDQEWMAENLKTTHYAGGTPLVDGTGIVGDFSGDYTTKYYFWYNDDSANSDIYGALYTWAAAMNGAASSETNPSNVQGVCPDGWHLPSDAEWTELTDYLGGIEIAGGKMKETGTSHWSVPNEGATNESGFNALPGGVRGPNNSEYFFAMGEQGKFHSTTTESDDSTRTYNRRLYYDSAEVDEDTDNSNNSLSVRCLKNNTGTSINQIEKNNPIRIYPNPTKGNIYIDQLSNNQSTVFIYNLIGSIIYTKQITQANATLNISDLQKGIYFIQVKSDKSSSTEKIILE